MPSVLSARILIVLNLLTCVSGGKILQPSSLTVTSSTEVDTRLPCQFQPSEDESVIQVTWYRKNPDGTKEQIITAHHTEGQLESAAYAGRVRFEGSDPIKNCTLIIMNTVVADEGDYTCTVSTFPSGNTDAHLSLIVWTTPISSLDPVIMVEGQPFQRAATCRSVAKPLAGLSWDTDLPGQGQNRSQEKSVSSILFSIHPLRSMNGRKLDCLVWHPTLKSPRRISNNLVVHYPPDAVISGYDENWYVGLEGAKLQCNVGGNPKPDVFNWTRTDGRLPEGVTVEMNVLRFDRPLSLTDKGVYQCVATNPVGSGKADLEIIVAGQPQPQTSLDSLLLVIIGAVAGALVLILVIVVIIVNRHYKRKNKQLTIELNEKREEISTLSRQASIRRVSSINTDNKYQMDELAPLRVEGTLRNSLSSLDRPRSRESRSTLGGLDSLGRPIIYNSSRRGRERMEREREASRLKVEAYVRESNLSLVHPENHFLPPLHPSPVMMEKTGEIIRSRNGSAILPAEGRPQSGVGSRVSSRGHQSPLSSTYPTMTDEEEGDTGPADEDSGIPMGPAERDGLENGGSETTSSLISEAMSNHFENSNGTLWPKSKPNNILLSPETTRILSIQAPIIHHQPQIV